MTSIAKRGAAQRRRDRGASIVELALLAPVMVLLVMGVLDLARGYQMQIQLENAAREGAGFAQIYPNNVTCGVAGDVVDRVTKEEAGVSSTPDFRVEVFAQNDVGDFVEITGCDGTEASPGERVRVQVTARFDIITPLVAQAVGGSIDIAGSAEVRVQG